MFALSVFLLGPILVQGIQLGEPSGLNFDVNHEYATSYEDYKPSDYQFGYGVSDPHTGDHKSHWEVKENGVVRGEYRLLEPDGTTRIVQYTADDHNGFRATVKKIGHAVHPINVHQTPLVQSAPDLSVISQDINANNYFKTYDGSVENYANTAPVQIPYHESDALQNHQLPFILSDVQTAEVPLHHPEVGSYKLSEEAPLKILHEEPYSIPNIAPSQEYISQQALHPAYIPENVPLQYSKNIPLPLQIPQPVNIPKLLSQNIEHLTVPLQTQNVISYPENRYIVEDVPVYAPAIDPLLVLGLRIDHPHGESSSSFYGRTGNFEDDSSYTSHGTASGW